MVVSPCYVLFVFCGQGDKAQDSIHVRFPKTGSKGLTPRPFFYFRRSHLYPVCLPRIPLLANIFDEARIGMCGDGYRTTGD